MDHQAFELLKDSIDELRKDVKEIKTDLGHYKGFLIFASIYSAFTLQYY